MGLRYSLVKSDGKSGPPCHSLWQHRSAVIAVKLWGWACENPFVGSILLVSDCLREIKAYRPDFAFQCWVEQLLRDSILRLVLLTLRLLHFG